MSGLHEELKQLLRTRFGKQNTKFDHKEGSWSEVGVKNKKRVVVANGFGKEGRKETCISHAFRGNLRIVLSKKSAGMKDTVSSQPFFSLHLNVAEHGIDVSLSFLHFRYEIHKGFDCFLGYKVCGTGCRRFDVEGVG